LSVRIRLQRCGQKKKPFYRIVVIDSRKARDSKPIEYIGYYNPLTDNNPTSVNMDRFNYWLKCGAKPSETVKSIVTKFKENSVITV
jgi:small subunit ribosomal protein S16